MIHSGYRIISVQTDAVDVMYENYVVHVILPSVISRMPRVDDLIIFEMDDVDDSNGIFINYFNESPKAFTAHLHYLTSDSDWNSIKDNFPDDYERPKSGGTT